MVRKYTPLFYLLLVACFCTSLAVIAPGIIHAAPAVLRETSNLWSGYDVEVRGATTSTGIKYVYAEWNISCNRSSKPGNTHATWIGIGGADVNKSNNSPASGLLSIKIGTSSDGTTNGGLGNIWIEDGGNPPQYVATKQNCRDHITATISYNEQSGKYEYVIVNTSSKHAQKNHNGVFQTAPDPQSALWMDSRAICDGNVTPLDGFGYSEFTNARVKIGSESSYSSLATRSVNTFTMRDGGTTLAAPTSLSGSRGGSFNNNFKTNGSGAACNVYSNARF